MARFTKTGEWYWMPTMVLLLGMLSVALLLTVNRINERQIMNAALVHANQKIQINAVSFHLLQEEHVGGDTSTDISRGLAGVDEAISLADSILNNGGSPSGSFAEISERLELRTYTEKIKSLLIKFRKIGLECLQKPESSGFGTIADQQFHAVYLQILEKAAALEYLLEKNRDKNRATSRSLFLGLFAVWTFVVAAATAGLWNIELRRKRAEESLLQANSQLVAQTEELTLHRENLAEIIVQRTADLTAANELLREKISECREAEVTLKSTDQRLRLLSSRLLTAQELERSRISRELHDELGQALNVTKLRIRAIEKGMRGDQSALRENCEQLLDYLDNVIEEVRRLSLDLSPAVLEDLGLVQSIQWLVGNLARISSVAAATDIDEIDHLFHRNQWITIYRVIQEALTNIGRHAQANKISVTIRRRDDKVLFLIEDDGKGFDPELAAAKYAPDRGLGLPTMAERVWLLNGIFDLRSREGEGTRISFSIPVHNEEV